MSAKTSRVAEKKS